MDNLINDLHNHLTEEPASYDLIAKFKVDFVEGDKNEMVKVEINTNLGTYVIKVRNYKELEEELGRVFKDAIETALN